MIICTSSWAWLTRSFATVRIETWPNSPRKSLMALDIVSSPGAPPSPAGRIFMPDQSTVKTFGRLRLGANRWGYGRSTVAAVHRPEMPGDHIGVHFGVMVREAAEIRSASGGFVRPP